MADAPLILHLVWDEWNRDHIAKHGVTPAEVEEVVGAPLAAFSSYKGRTVLIGRTSMDRVLAVVVGAVPGKTGFYYPFSARTASRKERRYVLDLGTEP